MRIRNTLFSLSVLLPVLLSATLFLPASGLAQETEKEKAQKELERRQELERKTLALLDEVVAAVWSLKLTENRAFVLTNAADSLWTHDEKRARNLFWEALNTFAPTTLPAGNESGGKGRANDKTQSQDQYFALFATRREFLRRVARRDPQLALDMLRATRQPPPPRVDAQYRLPDESDLEQEIASAVAERDPKRALQIARESLGKGLTFEAINLLFWLNRQSPETASEFAGDIIDKLRTANLANDMVTCGVTIQLLRFARTTPDAPGENTTAPPVSKPLVLNDDQKRELVEIITDAALSTSTNQNFLSVVTAVMPEIEQFAPDRAARLKLKMAEFNRTMTSEQKQSREYDALWLKGTPEEMIKAAAGTDGETRESFYEQAILNAVMSGRADQLREFIGNEVDDASRRNNLLDLLDAHQISFAADRGKTEDLQKLLPLIRRKEHRALAMAQLAILLEKKGEHDDAVKLLDDAQTLIKIDLKSETQSEALMTLLLAYAQVDPAKAFAIAEPTVDRANDELAKALLIDKVLKSGFVKKGEIILSQSGASPLDFVLLKYGKGVIALANADFNRTKAVADRFQRNELRILARLLIVQALFRSGENAAKISEQQVR